MLGHYLRMALRGFVRHKLYSFINVAGLSVALACAILILLFNELVIPNLETASIIRLTGLIALVLNGPYYLALRTGRWMRGQAYIRMLVDVALLTAGLYGAGGLAAAQYIAVSMVVPVYAAFVFSSRASAVATMFATRATPPSSRPSTCSC